MPVISGPQRVKRVPGGYELQGQTIPLASDEDFYAWRPMPGLVFQHGVPSPAERAAKHPISEMLAHDPDANLAEWPRWVQEGALFIR